MKRILIITCAAVLLTVIAATTAFAAGNGATIAEWLADFIRYDFDTVEERPDMGSRLAGSEMTLNNEMIFEPQDVSGGWLAELAGEGVLTVIVGTLDFGDGRILERYIDIKGENGEVRLLQNSAGAYDGYNKTQFWSAKRQEGASVVKDFSEEIRSAILFELSDGSCRLTGYIEGEGIDFWMLELPESDYYREYIPLK